MAAADWREHGRPEFAGDGLAGGAPRRSTRFWRGPCRRRWRRRSGRSSQHRPQRPLGQPRLGHDLATTTGGGEGPRHAATTGLATSRTGATAGSIRLAPVGEPGDASLHRSDPAVIGRCDEVRGARRHIRRDEPQGGRRNVGARMRHDGVTDDEPAPMTVRDRLTAAGLSDSRIEEHMTAGRVRVDGEPVTELDTPALAETRVVAWAE